MAYIPIIRQIRNLNKRREANKLRWIYIDLDEPLQERPDPPKNFIMKRVFPPKLMSIAFLEDYFEKLSKLRNFEGIILHMRKIPNGYARIQSLRNLITNFRKTGKKVIVYKQNYDISEYYLASAADEVCLQGAGSLYIIGLQMHNLFLKNALEKRGYKADVVPISPYKSAGDMFRRTEFSKEDKEQRTVFLDTIFKTITDSLSSALNKTQDEIVDIINKSPYSAKEALEQGLIHRIISEENLIEYVRKTYSKGKKLKILTVEKSLKKLPILRKKRTQKRISIVSVEGTIVDGKSRKPPFKIPIPIIGDDQAGDQTIVRLLRKVKRDKRTKAVVFHVNSGGGSAASSEAMCSAIKELTKKKPVVVYFNVAASGGYYIATSSNWVVAQPMTLTGSIGVINFKFVTQDALQKQGINREYIRKGERAGLYSPDKPYSEEERKLVYNSINSLYDVFLDHVSEFRKMEREQIEKYCGGRIWSGRDALEIGLIDELGGIKNAINKAAELAKIKPEKCKIVDVYKAEADVPIWYKDGKIDLFLDDWIEPFRKTNSWMILPEKIVIE